MKYTPLLYEALEKYARDTLSRFHMPGHGGRIPGGYLGEVSRYDVTELRETDNLACPTGVIKQAETLASRRFGCDGTLFSCNGATLCLQAAIYAALKARPGGRVMCHRRVHKSVVNAFMLLGVQPEWFCDFNRDFCDCDIMVYTWTDYYGQIAPFEKIENLAEKYGFLTVADNAHGSHLAFLDDGKLHPTRHGTDFCVDSLHKTLPVLTGGACLNLKNSDWYADCREGMTLFGSTSPNYLIMASIDYALANLDPKELEKTRLAVCDFKRRFERFFDDLDALCDPLRLVLRCQDPQNLYDTLYKNGIKCEFWDSSGVVLIPPYGAGSEYFKPLAAVLENYDPGEYIEQKPIEYEIPPCKMNIRDAMLGRSRVLPIQSAVGHISAREYSFYPPGIPLIVPGEVFTQSIVSRLSGSFDKVRITE